MSKVKIKILNTKRSSIILIILITLFLLSVNSVNSFEIIDSFRYTNDIVIDGKWTTMDEWIGSSEKSLIFGKGSGSAYLRLLNDDNFLYFLVDFVSYDNLKTGDSCMVVFDTKNDGGSSFKPDDLAVLIRWNTPTEIYPAIQWGGWINEWEFLPSDFVVQSSINGENNPYSTDPHLIFEFKIPRNSLDSSLDKIGFICILICDNENISAGFPILQTSHQPKDWNDLILFNQTIQILDDATTALDKASDAIQNAELEGRTEGLTNAKSLKNQAEDNMEIHDYNTAISYANQASVIANAAIIPSEPTDKEDSTPGFEFIILISVICLVLLLKRKK